MLGAGRGTNIDVTDAVIANVSNLGTGGRCFSFHLRKAELVLVGRDILNIGETTAVNHPFLGCDLRTNPSSRSSTDVLLSLDIAETRSGLMARKLRGSL